MRYPYNSTYIVHMILQRKCEIRKKKYEIRKFILKASINYLSEISYMKMYEAPQYIS